MVLKMRVWAPELILVLTIALIISVYYNFSFMGGENSIIDEIKNRLNDIDNSLDYDSIKLYLNETCNTYNETKILSNLALLESFSMRTLESNLILVYLYCDGLEDVFGYEKCENKSKEFRISNDIFWTLFHLNTDLILERENESVVSARACELLGYIEDNDYEAIREMARSS